MNPLELTGLQRVQGLMDGSLPQPSMTQTLPMHVVAAAPGKVTFRARADARHMNPMGGVHGGFAATVLDSATGCAVLTMLAAGVSYGTVDLHVKLLRPLPPDRELTAEARALQVTRNIGFAEADLRDEQGTLLAHATATCAIFRPREG